MGAEGKQRTRVLILSQDLLGPQMAGPGLRYWELARVLSHSCAVTLAGPLSGAATHPACALVPLTLADAQELTPLLAEADVLVSNGFMLYHYPQLTQLAIPWVIDAYIPSPTEGLAYYATQPLDAQEAAQQANTAMLNRFFALGDFFLCANERQRDLYLGVLAAAGRLNPHTYAQDRTLRQLIDVLPFGLSAEPPHKTSAILKGVHPAVPADGKLLLWGGGIWDWLDPLTLVQALPEVLRTHPNTYLYFPGPRHPFAERVPDMPMHQRTLALADRLGLTDRHVFFGTWIPHAERSNYLLEADIGVSLHFPGVETRYAFRTRVLDYIWAGLPMVVTEGDSLAELVRERGLGLVVPPQDTTRLAGALCELLSESDARSRRAPAFAATAQELTWERVAAPLVAFCREPHLAADWERRFPNRLPAAEPASSEAGAPELETENQHLRAECAALREQVQAYERGRFIRFMAWVKQQRFANRVRRR